jgi:Mce-associated membrane protein
LPSNAPCADEEETNSIGDEPESDADEPAAADDSDEGSARRHRWPLRRFGWTTLLGWVILPGLAFLLAIAAGLLKWQDSTLRDSEIAGVQALQAAREGTVAMLSYKPGTVEKDLTAARGHLTGSFLDSYTTLTDDVVIPGAQQQRISAVAQVPAAATVSANSNQAVVLVFVNQTTVIGDGPPTDTASTVRVKLDKVRDQWLISEFVPI